MDSITGHLLATHPSWRPCTLLLKNYPQQSPDHLCSSAISTLTSSALLTNSTADKLGLRQVVSSPTRTTDKSSTLINHVYLSEVLTHSSCCIQPPLHVSDHSTIHVCLSNPHPSYKRVPRRRVWLYKLADFEAANTILQCLFSNSLPANDIDSLWSQWFDCYMTAISHTVPSKVVKRDHNLPFLSKELIAAMCKKAHLYKEAKRRSMDRAWRRYSQVHNKVTAALRAAKATYFDDLSSKLKTPKDFWSAYHKLTSKKDCIPVDLKLGSSVATSSSQKANLPNKFSFTCFSPTSDPSQSNTPQPPHSGPLITSVSCSIEKVHKLLANQKLHTTSGPDGISSHMLRAMAEAITPSITKIFNESLSQALRLEDVQRHPHSQRGRPHKPIKLQTSLTTLTYL